MKCSIECIHVCMNAVLKHVIGELPNVQDGFRKGRGTRYLIANIGWNIENAREFQKDIYFFFIDCAKAF